jgi:hypothetical protein
MAHEHEVLMPGRCQISISNRRFKDETLLDRANVHGWRASEVMGEVKRSISVNHQL